MVLWVRQAFWGNQNKKTTFHRWRASICFPKNSRTFTQLSWPFLIKIQTSPNSDLTGHRQAFISFPTCFSCFIWTGFWFKSVGQASKKRYLHFAARKRSHSSFKMSPFVAERRRRKKRALQCLNISLKKKTSSTYSTLLRAAAASHLYSAMLSAKPP